MGLATDVASIAKVAVDVTALACATINGANVDPATIDAHLPQTQCGQCGHGACMPYAIAITQGEAINRCPPGGDVLIARLAQLMGLPTIPLDTSRGKHVQYRQVALIDEDRCIGCTKCLPVCPVDAIIGGPKRLHSITQQDCTGCELCVAPCPVDCITLVNISDSGSKLTDRFDPAAARHAYGKHLNRVGMSMTDHKVKSKVAGHAPLPMNDPLTNELMRSVLANALARAQEHRINKNNEA